MSQHEFENYLALVSRLMRLNPAQTEMIRDELRDHLENRVRELHESGWNLQEATRRALEEFGDAAVLAQQFQNIFKINQKRWMMRFATFSIASVFAAVVLLMAMWPSPARFGSPKMSWAQEENPFAHPGDSTPPRTVDAEVANSDSASNRKKSYVRVMTSEDIDKKLLQPAAMDYIETPFVEVMMEIRDHYGINVILDQSALDDSLTEDELVTIDIKNTTLATALRLMLLQNNATYMVDRGILRLISLDVADDPEFHRRRIFDCRQLLAKITARDERVGQVYPLNQFHGGGFGGGGNLRGQGGGVFNVATQIGNGGGLGGGGGSPANNVGTAEKQIVRTGQAPELVQEDGAGNHHQTENETAAKNKAVVAGMLVTRVTAEGLLIELVKSSIDADSWDDTNGDGTLSIVGGLMVVTQNQNTLEEIEEFLLELDRRMK